MKQLAQVALNQSRKILKFEKYVDRMFQRHEAHARSHDTDFENQFECIFKQKMKNINDKKRKEAAEKASDASIDQQFSQLQIQEPKTPIGKAADSANMHSYEDTQTEINDIINHLSHINHNSLEGAREEDYFSPTSPAKRQFGFKHKTHISDFTKEIIEQNIVKKSANFENIMKNTHQNIIDWHEFQVQQQQKKASAYQK